MKVWVPIDLPDDCEVEHVLVRGRHQTFTLMPAGPIVHNVGGAIWKDRLYANQPTSDLNRALPVPVERWEYSVAIQTLENRRGSFQKDIQGIGRDGWELVSIISLPNDANDRVEFWFKRRLA